MDFLISLIPYLGGTAMLLAAFAYLARTLVKDMLDRDLKKLDADLRKEGELELGKAKDEWSRLSNRELEQFKNDLNLLRDREGWRHQSTEARAERIRGEILRWANPILSAVSELAARLENILRSGGHVALTSNASGNMPPGWSISYDYFMASTLYVFAQYFHWVRRLQVELSFELFESQTEKDEFLKHVGAVRNALSEWPRPGIPANDAGDRQLFSLQQRAIGSAMTLRKDGLRCMEVDEFMEAWHEPPLSDLLAPLQAMLESSGPHAGARWTRLEQVLVAVLELRQHCQKILGMPPKQTVA